MLIRGWKGGVRMTLIRTIYCPRCGTLQGVKDWRERLDSLVIELEPCGHVIARCARVEWVPDEVVAA